MSRRKNVLKRIQQLGLPHSKIAQHAVLSVKVFNLWLEGKVVLPYKNILKIADLLDLEPDDLVEVV
jgi:hypothetical protein